MNKRFKKFLASLLTVVMLLSMLPTSVFADGTVEPTPVVETTVEPTELIAEEPTEEPVEEPTEEPVEEFVVESAEELVEESAEEPVVEFTKKPAEEPVEEPVVESTEEPVEESAEELTSDEIVDTVQELADALGMTAEELAESVGMTVEELNAMTADEIVILYSDIQAMEEVSTFAETDSMFEIEGTVLKGFAEGYEDYEGSIVIPDGITEIGYAAFSGSKLTGVIIPNSVSIIGEDAFRSCENITSIVIPSNVQTIKANAFRHCNGLANLTLSSGVKTIGEFAFGYCGKLKDFTIPNSVITIDDKAFIDCATLTNMIIPSSVQTIGAAAFAYCTNLVNVVIPGSVETIERSVFTDCDNLESVVIGSGVRVIGNMAFANNDKLKSIDLPNTLTTIVVSAFSNCTSLEKITIPNSVTEIQTSAFSGCSSLRSITIPESVASLGNGTFKGCTGLESVTILSTKAIIPYQCFESCQSLVNVSLAEGMEGFEFSAFSYCSSLEKLIIPKSVTQIDQLTFVGSYSLVLYVYRDSPAHEYCKSVEGVLEYVVIDDSIPDDSLTLIAKVSGEIIEGEIVEGTTVTFTTESNSESVILYIDAFEKGSGNRYNAVAMEMTKNGTTFTAENQFTSAGRKIAYAKTAEGVVSAEVEINVVPAEIKLDTPVYTGTTAAVVGEPIAFTWTAVDNATRYTAWIRPVDNTDNVTDLSDNIVGQSVSYTFNEVGSYNLEIYAVGEEGYGASDACNVTITVTEAVVEDARVPYINPITSSAGTTIEVGAETTISTKASDDIGLACVEMFIDGVSVKKIENVGGPEEFVEISYTTDALTVGEHTVVVKAQDINGNNSGDVSLTITVIEKTCEHLKHGNDTYLNTEYRAIGSDSVHEKRDVYTHSCEDCFEVLPNVYTDWSEEEHEDDGNGYCRKCEAAIDKECDHSGEKEYIEDKSIAPQYVDTKDGVNHYIIKSYSCYCKDCGVFISTVVDEYLNAEKGSHTYDSEGVCVCGATTAVACPHTNATAWYDSGIQPIFENITETHHDVRNGYRMICDECGEATGESGYFDPKTEEHAFVDGVCVCGTTNAVPPVETIQLAKPEVALTGSEHLVVGETTGIKWNNVPNATEYTVYLWRNGETVDSETFAADAVLEYSHTFDVYGTYVIAVYATAEGFEQSDAAVNVFAHEWETDDEGNTDWYVETNFRKIEGDALNHEYQDVYKKVCMHCDYTKMINGDWYPQEHAFKEEPMYEQSETSEKHRLITTESCTKKNCNYTLTPKKGDWKKCKYENGKCVCGRKEGVKEEHYNVYYKLNKNNAGVIRATGTIYIPEDTEYIVIYIGESSDKLMHPVDANSPYIYKFSNENVLETDVEDGHAYSIWVRKPGTCTVEIWNEMTDKLVASAKVVVMSEDKNEQYKSVTQTSTEYNITLEYFDEFGQIATKKVLSDQVSISTVGDTDIKFIVRDENGNLINDSSLRWNCYYYDWDGLTVKKYPLYVNDKPVQCTYYDENHGFGLYSGYGYNEWNCELYRKRGVSGLEKEILHSFNLRVERETATKERFELALVAIDDFTSLSVSDDERHLLNVKNCLGVNPKVAFAVRDLYTGEIISGLNSTGKNMDLNADQYKTKAGICTFYLTLDDSDKKYSLMKASEDKIANECAIKLKDYGPMDVLRGNDFSYEHTVYLWRDDYLVDTYVLSSKTYDASAISPGEQLSAMFGDIGAAITDASMVVLAGATAAATIAVDDILYQVTYGPNGEHTLNAIGRLSQLPDDVAQDTIKYTLQELIGYSSDKAEWLTQIVVLSDDVINLVIKDDTDMIDDAQATIEWLLFGADFFIDNMSYVDSAYGEEIDFDSTKIDTMAELQTKKDGYCLIIDWMPE